MSACKAIYCYFVNLVFFQSLTMMIDNKIEIDLLDVMLLLVKLLELLEASIDNFSIKNIIKRLIALELSIERYQTSCEVVDENARDKFVNMTLIE